MNEAHLAIAGSVIMHVSWNLMARHQPRESFVLWWILLAHLLLLGPWGLYALIQEADWTERFIVLIALSALSNTLYFIALRRAYDFAPVALVYPLVRSSPFLIALWGLLFLGESLSGAQWAGILICVVGLWAMSLTGRDGDDGRAMPFALIAMLATSIYSLSDRAATGHIAGFGGIIGFLSFGYAASWIALTLDLRRTTGRWLPLRRPRASVIVVGGLCVGLAYALVIHAMRSLPPAVVVAFTNAGIVIATLLSIFVFREKQAFHARLAAAVVISAGLFIMKG